MLKRSAQPSMRWFKNENSAACQLSRLTQKGSAYGEIAVITNEDCEMGLRKTGKPF